MSDDHKSRSIVEWIEDRFRERRIWSAGDLLPLAISAGYTKGDLWSYRVCVLPINKRLDPYSRQWIWIAVDGWPK